MINLKTDFIFSDSSTSDRSRLTLNPGEDVKTVENKADNRLYPGEKSELKRNELFTLS